MKVFDDAGEWHGKTNFVDENNVLVGYDMGQHCCEDADWFIAPEIAKAIPEKRGYGGDLSGWAFDAGFFQDVVLPDENGWPALDAGGMVAFRLVNGDQEMFLHLFNCHNGYYGHGFTVSIDGKQTREGCL